MVLGAAVLSFGLFNIHSQSQITEGGILGLTLFLNHWTGISPGVFSFILDLTCYSVGWKLLGSAFLKNAFFRPVAMPCCTASGNLPDRCSRLFLTVRSSRRYSAGYLSASASDSLSAGAALQEATMRWRSSSINLPVLSFPAHTFSPISRC